MTSLNPPMTRRSTPPVALGASKPTVALAPSKASYTANLSLPCPLSLFAPSPPQVYHVYTEDPHVYTKVRPLMPNLPLPSLLSPAYSGSPVLLPYYCLLRTAMSTTKILLRHQDAYVDVQDKPIHRSILCLRSRRLYLRPRPLYLHRSPLCLQVYIYSREAFGKFDFRVFIV